jgi:hypothetical protein
MDGHLCRRQGRRVSSSQGLLAETPGKRGYRTSGFRGPEGPAPPTKAWGGFHELASFLWMNRDQDSQNCPHFQGPNSEPKIIYVSESVIFDRFQ